MPQEIIALQCAACKRLFPKTDTHLQLKTPLKVEEQLHIDSTYQEKKYRYVLSAEDVVFCNERCFADFITETKNRRGRE